MRIADLQKAFKNVIGWRQGYDEDTTLDPDLLISESGMYAESAHPLVTLNLISAIIPDNFTAGIPDWSTGSSFPEGVKVRHEGTFWINSQPGNSNEPAPGSGWVKYSVISAYIRQKTEDAISNMVGVFSTSKSVQEKTKKIVAERSLFRGAGSVSNLATVNNRFVGFGLRTSLRRGVNLRLRNLSIQIYGGGANLRMYLIKKSDPEAVKYVDVNVPDTHGTPHRFPVDWSIPCDGDEWVLGYYQSDLPVGVFPVNCSVDWGSEPCGACVAGELQAYRERIPYFTVHPFYLPLTESHTEGDLLDWSGIMPTYLANYGINFEYSIGCDLTDFAIDQKNLFARALLLELGYTMLKTAAANPDTRVNRKALNVSRSELLYEIEGSDVSRSPFGLAWDRKSAYKALDIDTSGLDTICLSCGNDNSIIYGSI